MGFASIIGYVAIFIVAVGMVFVLTASHTEVIKQKSGAIGTYAEIQKKKDSTEITTKAIIQKNNNFELIIENSGKEKLHLEQVNIFFESTAINNHTIELIPERNLVNSQLWDPNELVNITVPETLIQYINYSLKISTENGETEKLTFITKEENFTLNEASKTSGPVQNVKSKIQTSDDDRTTLTLIQNNDQYLNANYTLKNNIYIYSSNIIIEHFLNETAGVNTRDLEFHNGIGWSIIDSLTSTTTETKELFQINELTKNTRLRIHYFSTNADNVEAYIDNIMVQANVTKWWVN